MLLADGRSLHWFLRLAVDLGAIGAIGAIRVGAQILGAS